MIKKQASQKRLLINLVARRSGGGAHLKQFKVMKNFNLKSIMTMAHRTFSLKSAVMSWAECLKQAWEIAKLQMAMKKRVVEFFFVMVNGEVRQAFGSLLESHIDYTPNGKGKTYKDCVKYWDEVKGEWRQFKAYNFLRVVA